MNFIKRLFCKHYYSKPELKGWYHDYSGYLVKTWERKCKICGKKKRYKTW